MGVVDLRTLALGFLRRYYGYHELSLATTSSDELFIPLHELLGWLYTIIERDEVAPLIPPQRASALRFIRSRVHHRWADAVEFRDDVVLKPIWLGWQQGRHVYFTDPAVYAAWCWRSLSELPAGDERRRAAYAAELEGEPVHIVVSEFVDLLYHLTFLETADVLGTAAAKS